MHHSFQLIVLATTLFVAFIQPVASETPPEYLYVENTKGGDVTVISIPGHKIVGRIPASLIGGHPDDVVAAKDGSVIYVNREDNEDVIAISTRTEEELFAVPVSGIPHHMTLSADERYLFVPIFNYPRLDVIDLQEQRVVKSIKVGWGAHGTRLSPDGERLYVGHIFQEQIAIIDVATLQVERVIDLPEGVRPFEISPDEKFIYVQLSNTHGVAVVDVESGDVLQMVNMSPKMTPNQLKQPFPFTVNHGLALTKDGKTLLSAGSVTNNVVVYQLPEFKRIANIPVGVEPNWIIFNNDERFAYVTNREDDTLSVISMDSLTEIKRIKNVGDYPQRLDTAYVPDRSVSR